MGTLVSNESLSGVNKMSGVEEKILIEGLYSMILPNSDLIGFSGQSNEAFNAIVVITKDSRPKRIGTRS